MVLTNTSTATLFYQTEDFTASLQASSIFLKTFQKKEQKGVCNTMANLIYTANTTAQTIPVGGTVDLGSIIRRCGCALSASGNTITLHKSGYYDVSVGITATPTATGTVTATLYQDGVPYPGATVSATVAATDTAVALPIPAVPVRLCGECCTSNLTVVISGVEAVINNIAMKVIKD